MVDHIDAVDYRGWSLFVYPYYKSWDDHLLEVSSRGESLPLGMLQRLTQDILFALEFLQSRGIVHGDIKPDTIAYEDITGISLLTGFDSASFPVKPRSYYGGSPAFAPPDSYLPGKLSSIIDIWCVGCTLFKLVTKQFLLNSHFTDRSSPEQYAAARVIDAIQKVAAGRDYAEVEYRGAYKIAMENLRAYEKPDFLEIIQQSAESYIHDPDNELFSLLCDFISKCLHLDPEKRISVKEAMQHPFVVVAYDVFEF